MVGGETGMGDDRFSRGEINHRRDDNLITAKECAIVLVRDLLVLRGGKLGHS
jgi:hypothetical protein